ncbi:MAG: hypothetical protein OJF47_000880 [Nitrospira sp.]|nr:MAG: hypothetical protein OJF47_000880 [Nitrospira sp.]
MDQETLGFPFWLRIRHFINLFCIFLLMRSGGQILADHQLCDHSLCDRRTAATHIPVSWTIVPRA